MKKRILALALAGTTAFSVFGGLNVFAAKTVDDVYGDEVYKTYAGTEITWTNGTSVTIAGEEFTGDEKFADFEAALDKMVFDKEATIELGNVYMFDYVQVDKDEYDALLNTIDDIKGAEEISEGVIDELTSALVAVYGTAPKFENNTDGAYNTFRREVTDDLYALKKDHLVADDFAKDDDGFVPYAFDRLLKDLDKTTNATRTSRMLYVMQEYERIVGLMDPADQEGLEDTIARYTDVLDARSEADYKSASSYYKFQGDYMDLTKDHEDAESYTEMKAYAKDLYSMILNKYRTPYTSAGVDKGELNDMIAFAAGFEGKKEYGFNKIESKWTAEYDYFNTILTEARAVSKLSKSYSYQSTVDAYTALLSEAVDGLEANTTPADWVVLRLETAVEEAQTKVESDYKASAWKAFSTALANAEKGLESDSLGSARAKSLAETLEKEMEDLYDGRKAVSVSLKNDLKDAIADAEKVLKDLNETASGSQLLALSTAIDDAKDIQKNISKALISEVEDAIAAMADATTLAQHPQGWYQNDAGTWFYGVGTENYTGWLELNGRTYFLKDDGSMAASTWVKTEKGYWYYLNASGAMMHDGWAKINDTWYFFKNFGGMAEGWVKDGNTWYYLTPGSGAMVSNGWSLINGKYYYFDASGAMLANTTTPDGYKVDASGAWVK